GSAQEFGQNISIECRQQSVGAREFVVGDEADGYRARRCFAVASLDTPFDGMKNGGESWSLGRHVDRQPRFGRGPGRMKRCIMHNFFWIMSHRQTSYAH